MYISTSSHGDDKPIAWMIRCWVFCIMLPAGTIAWRYSQRWWITIASALLIPAIAISQGAYGILKYRFFFGDAPVPLAPSHGVVIVNDDGACGNGARSDQQETANSKKQSQVRSAVPFTLGCECESKLPHSHAMTDTIPPPITTKPPPALYSTGCVTANDIPDIHRNKQRPLSMLVIGDSLAIGVGQARQCTPILPEAMAKTLSRRLNGRAVYWTCHGAPGASTGWVVRELERGADAGSMEKTLSDPSIHMNCSDTDESSSDDSSLGQRLPNEEIWRERMAQHRKRFNPHSLGPYDIVVVLTGSNDLKSALFPFLLTGEDAELRRQAKARGGNYTQELRRLLETLNRGMRCRLQNIRYSVEAATETVIERVEETMERISSLPSPRRHHLGSTFREKLDARKGLNDDDQTIRTEATVDERPKDSPLVVLPGLPARALPFFRTIPVRWLAVPTVDILDLHKRGLAKSHPGEVLFVPPPSIDDMSKYENCTGEFWRDRVEENSVFVLRDIRRRDCRRIEDHMQEYYKQKDKRVPIGVGLRKRFKTRFSRKDCPAAASLFSIDGIHPTHQGYDFWGRYIANAVVEEWTKHAE